MIRTTKTQYMLGFVMNEREATPEQLEQLDRVEEKHYNMADTLSVAQLVREFENVKADIGELPPSMVDHSRMANLTFILRNRLYEAYHRHTDDIRATLANVPEAARTGSFWELNDLEKESLMFICSLLEKTQSINLNAPGAYQLKHTAELMSPGGYITAEQLNTAMELNGFISEQVPHLNPSSAPDWHYNVSKKDAEDLRRLALLFGRKWKEWLKTADTVEAV